MIFRENAVWTGTTAVGEAVATLTPGFDVLFTWDAQAQAFNSFNPTGPAFLNTPSDLSLGDGVWVNTANEGIWEQPSFGEAREVPLSAGFNLVMWTGSDGTSVDAAIAEIAGNVTTLFTWDAQAQAFRRNDATTLNFGDFGPTGPAFLNQRRRIDPDPDADAACFHTVLSRTEMSRPAGQGFWG